MFARSPLICSANQFDCLLYTIIIIDTLLQIRGWKFIDSISDIDKVVNILTTASLSRSA